MGTAKSGDLKITSIRVTEKTKKRLSEHGKHGQTFDEIINKLLEEINGKD